MGLTEQIPVCKCKISIMQKQKLWVRIQIFSLSQRISWRISPLGWATLNSHQIWKRNYLSWKTDSRSSLTFSLLSFSQEFSREELWFFMQKYDCEEKKFFMRRNREKFQQIPLPKMLIKKYQCVSVISSHP